jgi:hypothetical protein
MIGLAYVAAAQERRDDAQALLDEASPGMLDPT